MKSKFEIEILEKAFKFIEMQPLKVRSKIFQNLRRASNSNDPKLFKKLTSEIWEFRTVFNGTQYRLLAFWDKKNKNRTLVIATHGFIKKESKVRDKEIKKANNIRIAYLKNK